MIMRHPGFGDDAIPLPRQRPLSPPTAPQLAILYALTNFPRLLLLAYLPIVAIQLLPDAQSVSILYLVSSLGAVVASVGLPKLLGHVRRRPAYVLIASTNVAAFASFALGNVAFLYVGLFLFVLASAANEILLNLYALENLSRAGQSRYEPLRVTFSIVGFISGPAIGVLAGTWISPRLPYLLATISIVAGFIFLYRTTIRPLPLSARPLPNPLKYMLRYLAQPRLRLAYALSLGRAAWWQMFFVYSPILVLELGYSPRLAGFISSISLAMTVFIPLWAKLANVIGVRRMAIFGFTIIGITYIILAACAGRPTFILALLVTAAFCATSLDSVGNIFFLRAVHPFERVEMSAVFSTYRDASQAIPPLVIAPLLHTFELPLILGLWGSLMIGLALLSRYLPRRL
jgi:MFS family permease